MEETSEKKIIDLCKKGDRAAQKAVYDSLAPKMFAVCLKYVTDRSTAEDLLQDGFVTLFSKIDSYKGEGSFEGWARKIFVNTALMHLRKKDALKMSEDIDAAWNIASGYPTQIQNLGYRELLGFISSMPEIFRTVFNMYVLDGYTHKEIAEALGISEVNSRTLLMRARAMMQEKIDDYENRRHE